MMKAILSIAALLFTLGLFAQSGTEADVMALSKKRVQWLLKGNLDSLANLYDANGITVHGNGLIKSTPELMDDVKSGRPIYRSIDYKDATVNVFENTAVLVGKGVFSISIFGQDMTQDMVFMEVYMKKGKQWKLIARQASQVQ